MTNFTLSAQCGICRYAKWPGMAFARTLDDAKQDGQRMADLYQETVKVLDEKLNEVATMVPVKQ